MVVNGFCQLYCTISGEELFVFGNKKCRIYAACGVLQTPIFIVITVRKISMDVLAMGEIAKG